MINKKRYFPDLSARSFAVGLSDEKTDIKLDGMQVVFDKKVAATPVSLDYKKKKSNAN